MKLPPDLVRYRRRRILGRLVPCAVLVLLFAAVLVLWGDTVFGGQPSFQIVCSVLFMLLPFAVTGVPFKLMDRTYGGRVERVSIKTATDNAAPFKPTRENTYIRNTVYLRVRTPDGRVVKGRAYSSDARVSAKLDAYREGDVVFHLHGTGVTVVLPERENAPAPCAVCGSLSDAGNTVCHSCGHTLVRRADLVD